MGPLRSSIAAQPSTNFTMRTLHRVAPSLSRPFSSFRNNLSPPPPSSFPITQSCPSPTCPCAETPSGLDIDHERDLNGTMAPYAQQLVIATGQDNWRSRIEEDGVDEGWGMLVRGVKGLVGRGGRFADPYNNVMVTNSSFPPASTLPTTTTGSLTTPQTASAFLFPAFRYIPNVPLDDITLEHFVRAFLLPREPHPAHNILPAEKRQAMARAPELESTFPQAKRLKHSPTILICGHGHRDQRCGIMGPVLQAEFHRAFERIGYSAGGKAIDDRNHANVGLISHIGGHKYAGNVIVYLPPSFRSLSTTGDGGVNALAGKGIWYGRVEPRHVEGIVQETICKGRVIADHFRGGIDEDGGVLRL